MKKTVHERFSLWVDSLDITARELSRQLGVTHALISNIRHAHRNPGEALAKRIEERSRTWAEGPIRAVEWAKRCPHCNKALPRKLQQLERKKRVA